jgi:hypothetical protein
MENLVVAQKRPPSPYHIQKHIQSSLSSKNTQKMVVGTRPPPKATNLFNRNRQVKI